MSVRPCLPPTTARAELVEALAELLLEALDGEEREQAPATEPPAGEAREEAGR